MKKNCWHEVEGYPELRVGQYIVPNFVSNTIAIRINKNEFIVVSPGESLLDSWHEAWVGAPEPDKTTLHIVMPNAYHYMGVEAWTKKFPNYRLYASRMAIPRLVNQEVVYHSSEINALEQNELPLPEGYEVACPPGHRAGDAWLIKRDEDQCLWVTCDSFLNYDRVSNQPIARAMQKLLGAAPGLKMSQVVKWFIIKDRSGFKSWVLDKLKHAAPTTLIPSHGEVSQSSTLASDIEQVVRSRL